MLTGTPVQNNVRELYALLSFVAPHIFTEHYTDGFVERYSGVTDNSGRSLCIGLKLSRFEIVAVLSPLDNCAIAQTDRSVHHNFAFSISRFADLLVN